MSRRCQTCGQGVGMFGRWMAMPDAVSEKVTIKVKDVIDYYGRNASEKKRMKQVALSIIQRCRIAYGRSRDDISQR